MGSLQPPFVVDIICYLLIIALIYLVYYSFNLRKEILNQKFEQLLPTTPPPVNKKPKPQQANDSGKLHFFIEPSPISGQKVLFPSIYSQPELSLSVIVPVHDMQHTIINTLEKIQFYFSEKKEKSNNIFSYEVIVVDMQSTDNTYSIVYDYALQNQDFRILKIPIDLSLNYALVIAGTRVRGKLLFIYLPDEDLPIDVFSQLELKITSAKDEFIQKEIIALSCLVNSDSLSNYSITDNSDYNQTQTFYDDHYIPLLSSFVDYLANKIFQFTFDVEPNLINHFRTMLLTREAALVIFPNIKMSGDWFDLELLVIALKEKFQIKYINVQPGNYYGNAIDISSWERIYRFLDLSQNLLLYSTGVWKIVRRRP